MITKKVISISGNNKMHLPPPKILDTLMNSRIQKLQTEQIFLVF